MFAIRPTVRALRTPATRRFQSTSTHQAAATASAAAGKAAAGLSKAASAAGPAIANAAQTLSKVGGPVGKAVGLVEKTIPHVVFYSKVGAELGKYVAKGQNITKPDVASLQAYWLNVFNSLKNPAKLISSAQQTFQTLRTGGITTAQLAAAGVLGAELLGFFTVGEIIGRFKLIGYHSSGVSAAHH